MPPALRSSLLLGLLALSARGEVVADSPEAMAAAVRALVSSGAGALMPDLDRAYVEDGGLVPLGEGDFPAMFLHGLVAEWRDGVAVFPVEVRLDDATGDAYFLDAAGEPFWYVPSNVPERYRPWLVANPWFAPSRAGIRWTFVHDADVALLRAASAPAARRAAPLRSVPPPPVTNLCFTGFSYTGTSVWFSAAWPASALPLPGDTLDVYAKTNLLDGHWFPLAELPVAPAATNATLEIAGEDIPGFFVPPHVHDASCPAVTNITFDLVSNEPVTGIVYRCHRYRAVSSGFLRLGTRLDTDGDGLTDSAEMLVHGTRPDRLDTDGDGVPDGISPMDWFSNPLWATNGMDADFLVDIVAPTDGSAETVLTLDGWRIPLSPRAGPWAFSLPPGEIVSCSVASTGPFFVLWAGGSFWNLPESFEKPVWTYGMLSVSGNHETAGSCQIAVPVLTVEPVLDEAPTAGTVPGCSHVSPDGSVCVHGEDGVQRFSLSASPSVLAIGRTPVATGSAQIDSTGPFIDVTGTTGVQEGTVGFGPGTESGSDGVLWGMLEKGVAAHRCDATPDNPYCSVCGCHRSEACDAAVFGDCATRVGSSARIRLQADRPRDWSLSGPSGFQMRLFANETGGTGSISVDHTSSVWVGGGGRPEKCIVTAKCPGEQCSGTELPVWTLQVTLETVTGSRDDRSFVINPAGSVVGETETFRLSVLPESYVSEQGARWQTEEGASVLDDGTEARIRFDSAGGKDVWFSMPGYVCAEPLTRCLVYPDKKRVPLHKFYIADETGRISESPVGSTAALTEVNRIWRQAGIEFFWASITYTDKYPQFSSVRADTPGLADFSTKFPGREGIRVFFAHHVSDENGNLCMFTLQSDSPDDFGLSFGIFLDPRCSPGVLAHELGHACGLSDIYTSFPDAEEDAPEFRREVRPDDFPDDGTGAEFYFPAGTTRSEMVSRLLMFGHGAVREWQADLPYGTVPGLDENGASDNVPCGILDVWREPGSM